MNSFDLLDMIYNPYGPNGLEQEESKVLNRKYILEYCNEYSYESTPDTLHYEWIQLLEGDDSIILEICMEPYMRIIDRKGNIIIKHEIQRQINKSIIKEG